MWSKGKCIEALCLSNLIENLQVGPDVIKLPRVTRVGAAYPFMRSLSNASVFVGTFVVDRVETHNMIEKFCDLGVLFRI
jgi:hypothetical protein